MDHLKNTILPVKTSVGSLQSWNYRFATLNLGWITTFPDILVQSQKLWLYHCNLKNIGSIQKNTVGSLQFQKYRFGPKYLVLSLTSQKYHFATNNPSVINTIPKLPVCHLNPHLNHRNPINIGLGPKKLYSITAISAIPVPKTQFGPKNPVGSL